MEVKSSVEPGGYVTCLMYLKDADENKVMSVEEYETKKEIGSDEEEEEGIIRRPGAVDDVTKSTSLPNETEKEEQEKQTMCSVVKEEPVEVVVEPDLMAYAFGHEKQLPATRSAYRSNLNSGLKGRCDTDDSWATDNTVVSAEGNTDADQDQLQKFQSVQERAQAAVLQLAGGLLTSNTFIPESELKIKNPPLLKIAGQPQASNSSIPKRELMKIYTGPVKVAGQSHALNSTNSGSPLVVRNTGPVKMASGLLTSNTFISVREMKGKDTRLIKVAEEPCASNSSTPKTIRIVSNRAPLQVAKQPHASNSSIPKTIRMVRNRAPLKQSFMVTSASADSEGYVSCMAFVKEVDESRATSVEGQSWQEEASSEEDEGIFSVPETVDDVMEPARSIHYEVDEEERELRSLLTSSVIQLEPREIKKQLSTIQSEHQRNFIPGTKRRHPGNIGSSATENSKVPYQHLLQKLKTLQKKKLSKLQTQRDLQKKKKFEGVKMGGRLRGVTHLVYDSELLVKDAVRAEVWHIGELLRELASIDSSIQWCARRRLLRNICTCSQCNRLFTCTRHTSGGDGMRWRCKPCNGSRGIRQFSFFEGSHISLRQIILLAYFWSHELPQQDILHEVQLSVHTVVDWLNYMRDVCEGIIEHNPQRLGGFDEDGASLVVEIIDSKYFRRKHHQGQWCEDHWVCGGIERDTGKSFLVEVEDRRVETLQAVIREWILPGTTIISNGWSAYARIDKMDYGVYHHVIIQQEYTIDENDEVFARNKENLWMVGKRRVCYPCVASRDLLPSYLAEFMWRQRFPQNQFSNFLASLLEMYP